MPGIFSLYGLVRAVNVVIFSIAAALILDSSAEAARGPAPVPAHWAEGQRDLTIVDRTGDESWHAATRHAVEQWQAHAPAGVRIRWEAGAGTCRADGTRISVCTVHQDQLGEGEDNLGREGLSRSVSSRSHLLGAMVLVCGDCLLDTSRQRAIAVHEVGHALGLGHNEQADSVMYPTGAGDVPTAVDVATLGQLYGHADEERRCALLNVRVLGFCV